MTENMAGRGEGLAGLAEAIKLAISAGADLRYDEYGVMEMPIGHLATKWDMAQAELQRILAALEAAAPAGTARPVTADFFLEHETSYTQHREFWVWECSCGVIEEEKFISWDECHVATRRHWAEKLNALATPSPQAPQEQCKVFSTTSAREQSSATAPGSPSASAGSPKHREWLDVAMEQGCRCGYSDAWHCAIKLGLKSISCPCPCHKYISAPAATQEPAGSGGSEPSMIAFEKTWQQLKRQMEYEEEALRRVPNDWPLEKRTAYWMYLSADNEGWEAGKIACMSGSPRKVGEDGASELKVGDSVRVSGIVESISTDGTLIKVDFGMGEYCYPNRLLLHPRPSSVPVGEQKQEEGV